MIPRRTAVPVALVLCAALLAGCSDDGDAADSTATTAADSTEVSAEDTAAVVEHYADGLHASYTASVASAEELRTTVKAFTDDPTEASLQAAKDQWLAARDDYGPTEAFRFYDGPIDDPEDGPEGQINAWPMDEAYVDYVEGQPEAGIINDAGAFPEITLDVAVSANEEGGETNISTGWHAIEFLLWGQDLAEDGPGQRPVSDYTSHPTAERRATYLNLLVDLLVEDLTGVAEQWEADVDDNFRAEWVAEPDRAVSDIFRGIGALTVGELAGERIAVAIETADQEDEHSCFSDNTNADVHNNALGVQWVYTGTYPGLGGGPGLGSLIESTDPDVAAELGAQIDETVAMSSEFPTTFDQMLSGDSAPLEEMVTALESQGDLIASAADALGISVDTGV